MKNRLGIEINIEAEMYVLSKQFIVLSPLKLQASHSARFYTYSVYSHSLLDQYHTQEKRKGEKKGRMVVTKSGKTGRKPAVFLVTSWEYTTKVPTPSLRQLTASPLPGSPPTQHWTVFILCAMDSSSSAF